MNTSLYAPNPKREPVKGTGFADKASAIRTLDIIKNLTPNHQMWIVTTMYNRAKFHPHQTPDMLSAMKVFAKWLKQKVKEKAKKYPFMSRSKIRNILASNEISLSRKQSLILNAYINKKKINTDLLLYRYQYIKKNINNDNLLQKVGYEN